MFLWRHLTPAALSAAASALARRLPTTTRPAPTAPANTENPVEKG